MRILRKNKPLPRLFCLLTLVAALSGCIKEDMDGCEPQYHFTVRAYDADNAEVTTPVEEVVLYVFDDNLCFVKEIETTVGTPVSVSAPGSRNIHVVGWGNLKGGNQTCPSFAAGDLLETGFVRLNATTRAASPHGSPDDLFHGELAMTAQDKQAGELVLPIRRKAGSMGIQVTGLKQYAGFDDDGYRIEVRETHNTIDFYGHYCGDNALYCPAGSFRTQSSKEIYSVSTFRMLPQSAGVSIDIFHAGTLVYTASAQDGGSPIAVQEGRHTDVNINLLGNISVNVSIDPWNGNQGGIDF